MSHPSPAPGAEPLAFTVHRLDAPGLDAIEGAEKDPPALRARTARGRLKMLLVLLCCAAPVLASYFTYFVVRPEGRTNYGSLIQPTRNWPEALAPTTLDGKPVAAASLRGQWLLLAVGPADCDAACEQRLYLQRQLREMLGRERDRLDKLWLLSDGAPLPPALRQALEQGPAPAMVLRVDAAALSSWLQAEPGRALQDHLYLVDPMGEWMLRLPAGADPQKAKRDLDRLLRASAFWDKAGR